MKKLFLLILPLLVLPALSACGHKGRLKSPSQIAREEEKKASEEQKKAREAEKKAMEMQQNAPAVLPPVEVQ